MKSLLSIIVVLVVFYARGIESLPSGAPAAACATLAPLQNAAGHARPPQTTAVPYMINLVPFNDSGTLEYNPGRTYTLTLTGDQQFKGFFVQARIVADDSTRVGSFGVADASNSRLSSCTVNTDGITHSNNNTKTAISFRWTAPPQGTGTLRFGFAVVRERNTYWANQRTAEMITEGDPTPTVMPTTTAAPTPTTAAAHITDASFWTILMVALAVVLKTAV